MSHSRTNPEKIVVGVLVAICVICGAIIVFGIDSSKSQMASIEESQLQQ